MSKKNQLSPMILRAARLTVVPVVLLLTVATTLEDVCAQAGLCIRKVNSSFTLDGVVAAGTKGICTPDAVWPMVAPAQFQPIGSPTAHLYLAYYDPTPTNPANDDSRLLVGIDTNGDPDVSDFDVVLLFFDANNNNGWDNDDFVIQVKVSPSTSSVTSGEQCMQTTGSIKYYQRSGSSWSQVNAAAAEINTSHAFDYDSPPGVPTADSDDNIWNLEIDMPIRKMVGGATRFNLSYTATPYFGVGAYVFADYNRQQQAHPGSVVLKWPGDITANPPITDYDPAFSEPLPNELANMSLLDVCFDVNFNTSNPWVINPGQMTPLPDHRINRNGLNTFHVTCHFEGPGPTPNLPNTIRVRLSLKPYNGSGQGAAWIKTKTATILFTQAPQDRSADISWNFGDPIESWSAFEMATGTEVNFLCADITLEALPSTHDDDLSNNFKNVNGNYFATSTYAHDFFIFGEDLPNLKPGESTTIFLRMQSTNEVQETAKGGFLASPFRWKRLNDVRLIFGLSLLGISLVIVILLLKAHRLPTLKYAGPLAVLALALLVYHGCDSRGCKPRPPRVGTDRWQVTNADQLGLKPVQDEGEWYQMPIKHGEIKRVALEFTGRPLPYQTVKHAFNPATAGGEPNILRIPVKPDEVATVLAFGQIDLDGLDGPSAPTTPTGFVDTTAAQQRRYLLTEGYYAPNEYAGALIGSFNNFETSFVVSRNLSVVVPDNANALSLAVNAVRGAYASITGAYEIFTVITPAPRVPTHTRIRGDATYQIPPSFDLWEVLTSLNIYTYYQRTEVDEGGGVRSRTSHPLGFVHYSIFDSHVNGN